MRYIDSWLTGLGLDHVIPKLKARGILTPKKLASLTLRDMYEVGVEDAEDRKKLYFLIQRLQAILNKEDADEDDGEAHDDDDAENGSSNEEHQEGRTDGNEPTEDLRELRRKHKASDDHETATAPQTTASTRRGPVPIPNRAREESDSSERPSVRQGIAKNSANSAESRKVPAEAPQSPAPPPPPQNLLHRQQHQQTHHNQPPQNESQQANYFDDFEAVDSGRDYSDDEEEEETIRFEDPLAESQTFTPPEFNEDMAIRVVVRKRPISRAEIAHGDRDVLEIPSFGTVLVHEPKTKVDLTKIIETQAFIFDDAFQADETNELIYRRTIGHLVPFIFEGGKASCFAYGQTGSGKTFTMMGCEPDAPMETKTLGLYVLAARDIFEKLRSSQFRQLRVYVSCFEIYGGKLFDLLNDRGVVKCLEDAKQQVQLPGLTEHHVSCVEDLLAMMAKAHELRSTGMTGANATSSRSHQVMQLVLKEAMLPQSASSAIPTSRRKSVTTVQAPVIPVQRGKLSFIDLAGSERGADTTHSSKQTRMEGAEINTSLLALKEVIRSLERKHGHTPFRGSKLTQVLKDSFVGERTRTCMIACVSPSHSNCEHTLNTLRYADRVKEHQTANSAAAAPVGDVARPATTSSVPPHPIVSSRDESPAPALQPPQGLTSAPAVPRSHSNPSRPATSSSDVPPPPVARPASGRQSMIPDPSSRLVRKDSFNLNQGHKPTNNSDHRKMASRSPIHDRHQQIDSGGSTSTAAKSPRKVIGASTGSERSTTPPRKIAGQAGSAAQRSNSADDAKEEELAKSFEAGQNSSNTSASDNGSNLRHRNAGLRKAPQPAATGKQQQQQQQQPQQQQQQRHRVKETLKPSSISREEGRAEQSYEQDVELLQKTVDLLSAHKASIAEMVSGMKNEMELVQEMESMDRDSDAYLEKIEELLTAKDEAIRSLRSRIKRFQLFRLSCH